MARRGKAEIVLEYFKQADPAEAALVIRLAKAELKGRGRSVADVMHPERPRRTRRPKSAATAAARSGGAQAVDSIGQ